MDYSLPGSLPMEFSRQEHWGGVPFLTSGDLPNRGIKPMSLASPVLAGGFFTTSTTWETQVHFKRFFFFLPVFCLSELWISIRYFYKMIWLSCHIFLSFYTVYIIMVDYKRIICFLKVLNHLNIFEGNSLITHPFSPWLLIYSNFLLVFKSV